MNMQADGEAAIDVAADARMISQAELWNRLGVSKATGHRMIAAGEVGPRSIRVRGSLRYYLREVVAWLEQRATDGNLHDATNWPGIWATLQKHPKGGR
jgi:predicted DNA-binding transcriptional regulator AlpA